MVSPINQTAARATLPPLPANNQAGRTEHTVVSARENPLLSKIVKVWHNIQKFAALFYNDIEPQIIPQRIEKPGSVGAVSIKSLLGSEITPYVKTLSALYRNIFREAPYFYYASSEAWDGYIQSYANTPDALASLALCQNTIVGCVIGTPVANASEKYRKAFSQHPEDLHSLFYLGEIAMKPELRGLGIGKQLYKACENVIVEKKRFTGICIWRMSPEDKLWELTLQKQGFRCQAEIHFDEFWSRSPDTEEIPHPMVSWIKRF